MSKKIDLSRRKVLGGLAALGAAGAASGAGTFALFSDSASSKNNKIQAGTLDISAGNNNFFKAALGNLRPGQTTGEQTVSLTNNGSLNGDHVELTVSSLANHDTSTNTKYTGNGAKAKDMSADDTAKRLFFTELKYGGNEVGFTHSALSSLAGSEEGGAFVFDLSGSNDKAEKNDGKVDVQLLRETPSGNATATHTEPPTEPAGVVHATSNGTATEDYAISMRGGFDVSLSGLNSGDITYKYYGGPNNENSAADEVWVVVKDSGGTDHLLYRHDNHDGTANAATWKTRDVAAELKGNLGDNYNWKESGSGTVSNNPASDYKDGYVKAVGFGRGDTSTKKILDSYYADLVVNKNNTYNTYQFRPMSLYDLSRGVVGDLPTISANGGSKDFTVEFQFDTLADNRFQGDGVKAAFEFGIAQKSGQNVL